MLHQVKVKKVTYIGEQKVHDITVDEVSHYMTEDGIVHHNSGIVYSASIILNLSKAKLKETDGSQSGVIVTARPEKNRFAIPHTVKFHISYNHGMNAYVGLEEYILKENAWDLYGAGRGKFITDKDYSKLSENDKNNAKQHPLDPSIYFLYSSTGRNICTKHSTEPVPLKELFSDKVFSKQVLEALDADIQKEYAYSGYSDINKEVENLINKETED